MNKLSSKHKDFELKSHRLNGPSDVLWMRLKRVLERVWIQNYPTCACAGALKAQIQMDTYHNTFEVL